MNILPASSPLMLALAYHYDSLVSYVRRNFSQARNDQHFAQEVVHDVCIALMSNPPAYTVNTPLAYLRLASKNRAIDLCRADNVRFTHVDYVADVPNTHLHYEDGEQALDFVQKLETLKQMIESLPPRQRQVFLLHRLHDMPQQEIANALSISRNMVTQHFNRAIQTIAQQWQAYLAE